MAQRCSVCAKQDFGEIKHHGGISPAWPISYDELEPYYTEAERIYHVHGEVGEDPTEPHRSGPYPYSAISHEPRIQQLSEDFALHGLKPFHTPLGVMLDEKKSAEESLHPLQHLRRLPLPGQCQSRRAYLLRRAGVKTPECHPANRHESHTAETDEHLRPRSDGSRSGTQRARRRPTPAACRGCLRRRDQFCRAACCVRRTTNTRTAWPMARMSSAATTWAT